MNLRAYLFISGVVFTVVAIAHLLRIINQFPIILGSWSAPMAGSWIGLIIAGLLGLEAFKLYRRG